LSKGRLLAVVAFLLLPTGVLVGVGSPAFAGKQPVGNVTCNVGGGVSFKPALTSTGTPGGHEKVTFQQTLTGCVGSPGMNVPSSASMKIAPVKVPAVLVGGKKVVGDCHTIRNQVSGVSEIFGNDVIVSFGVQFQKVKTDMFIQWQAGTLLHELGHNVGLNHGGNGSLNVGAVFASNSAVALQNCINGSGGPISAIAIDPIKSFVTLGPTVLTTGSAGGPNAAISDLFTSGVAGGPNCTSGTAQATVQTNPAVPGTAALQLTALSYSGCSLDMGGAVGTIPATVVANNLPYPMSIGDGTGDPATLGMVSLTISVNGGSTSCTYASPGALTGGYANATNSITFSGSALAFTGGTGSLSSSCPTASLSPPLLTSVVDSSVSGSPAVFVN
jgi:hypothetical protein